MRVTKKLTTALAVGAIAAVLGACSGGGGPASGSGTAGDGEAQHAANLEELTTIIQAAQDKATSGHMEMTYGGEAAETAGMAESTTVADFAVGESDDVADMTLQMSTSAMGMDFDMRLVDGVMYVNMGQMSQGKYIEMPLDELANDPSFSSTLDSMKSMDVAAQAAELKDAVTSFEHTGTETVDGVEVDVYTLTIDPTKLKEGAAGLDAETSGEISEMTVVYKIDADGLPLEADMAMDVQGQELTMDSTFSGWGEPVTVQAPSKDEIVSLSEITGG